MSLSLCAVLTEDPIIKHSPGFLLKQRAKKDNKETYQDVCCAAYAWPLVYGHSPTQRLVSDESPSLQTQPHINLLLTLHY